MTVQLLHDVDKPYGLTRGLQIETYCGFGEECGTVQADGTPNGKVWVECPFVPIVRNRAGDVVSWKSAFVLLCPTDFQIIHT